MKNNILAFFDYNCPFCYIGFNIIEELKDEFNINCIYKPCELYPDIQSSGASKEECLKGYDIDKLYKKLRILGRKNNTQFGSLDMKYNSHKALLLAIFAQNNNKIHEFSKEIYLQYYNFDKDISNDVVLRNIYDTLKLDYEFALLQIKNENIESKLRDNLELKEKLNIKFLPTYIINDDIVLSGIVTKKDFLKALK